MTVEHTQKQIKDIGKCKTVGQRAIPASAIIFHQAKKQFAALRLENKSSSLLTEKPITNVRVSVKQKDIPSIQTLPSFQKKIPILKISPSLNIGTPKYLNDAIIKTEVPKKIVVPRERACKTDLLKKVTTNNTVMNKTPQTSKITGVRVKAAITQLSNQQKHTNPQYVSSPNKNLIKINTPITLRTKPGLSYVSSNTSSPLSSVHQKQETKDAEFQKETQKKQPGAIKVISVNALNSRQPKVVTTENIPNKPLRLAPFLPKTNITSKTGQCPPSNGKSLSLKPFASVTNLVSHEKSGKPTFVTSNTNNINNQARQI
ncbi:hypothetical protein PCANB_000059 [Pneumocystis canis]|nr:hypothetical protein PCK1_000127 [Pneumocystis canis]KAG5439777.1 hypothetical protein PCANB_000059 [Pneumocystis canis]